MTTAGFNNRRLTGRRVIATIALLVFLINTLVLPIERAGAQEALALPAPGQMVGLSQPFNPSILKGLKVYADNPFRMDFILDKGDAPSVGADLVSARRNDDNLKFDSERLVKYFLAALTTPEKDIWVNLSPYEKDRIITDEFGQTDMGRDLLAQDYLLKQITSSVMYPEGEIGKKFWAKVYKTAFEKYGTTDIPIDTFNKVWIVPEHAKVYEHGDTAFIVNAKLKVMLETDYLATSNAAMPTGGHVAQDVDNTQGTVSPSRQPTSQPMNTKAPQVSTQSTTSQDLNDTNIITKNIIREIILPQLEKEVNEGSNFASLRQVYYSLILSLWFKKRMKDSILGRKYMDQNKVTGININDKDAKQKIYDQYVQAFKKGVYNYVKEENDPLTNELIPRKYFSGGFSASAAQAVVDYSQEINPAEVPTTDNYSQLAVNFDSAEQSKPADHAADTFRPAETNQNLNLPATTRVFDSTKFAKYFLDQLEPYLKTGKSISLRELNNFEKWGVPSDNLFPKDANGKHLPLTKEEMTQIFEQVINKIKPFIEKSDLVTIPMIFSRLKSFLEGTYPYNDKSITDLLLHTEPLANDLLQKWYPNHKVVVLGRDGMVLLIKDFFANRSKYTMNSHTIFMPGFAPHNIEHHQELDDWSVRFGELFDKITNKAETFLGDSDTTFHSKSFNEDIFKSSIRGFNGWLDDNPEINDFLKEMFIKQIEALNLAKNEHVLLYDTLATGKSILIVASMIKRLRPDVSLPLFCAHHNLEFWGNC
ncbi:MAG: hypothetical protein HQL24_10150 [Candidatus Omnitrophica bacterium]|nr:hypothetical protein [Candidatus Omnitrophota bacterium]